MGTKYPFLFVSRVPTEKARLEVGLRGALGQNIKLLRGKIR